MFSLFGTAPGCVPITKFLNACNPGQRSIRNTVRGKRVEVPFYVRDLVAYLHNLPRPQYQVLQPWEARVARRMFTKEWDLAAEKIIWRLPLPLRIETPGLESHIALEYFNPAVWFALQGKYTIANFLADRSLSRFIEDHWRRLSLQFGGNCIGEWEYHNAADGCRCPGYTLSHLIVSQEANKIADAILDEILSHIDSLIVDQLKMFIENFEEERRRANVQSSELVSAARVYKNLELWCMLSGAGGCL